MRFTEEPAQSFIVRAVCDCGGEMERSSKPLLLTQPPKVPHECRSCGAEENLDDFYPKVISKPSTHQHRGESDE